MTLIGKYMTYALLAVAVDLVWGYCGILSLGHAAFFALGGYAMGMYLMRQIGTRGVYGNPVLPDFMVFLNYKELPWFWHGFDMFWFAMLMVALVPGLLALVFGWLAFRSRVTGVYLSIITQALTYALMLAFFRNDMGFGGNNGMTDFKDILGFAINTPATRVALFVASAVALIARLSRLPLHHAVARGARGAGHPRRREPHALHRLPRRVVQAVDLHVLGGARRHRRRAVRAAGRHHQSQRVPADQLHRGGDLGGGRRARHVVRRRGRRGARELREDLLHRRAAGVLAVRAGPAVRAGHAVPAARRGRACSTGSAASRRRPRRRKPRRCPHERGASRQARLAEGLRRGHRQRPARCPAMRRTARSSTSKTSP